MIRAGLGLNIEAVEVILKTAVSTGDIMKVQSRRLSGVLVLGLICLFCNSSVLSQSNTPGNISGRVVLPNGQAVSHSVRISLETMRGVKSSVFTDNQGQFIFRSLAPGIYQVIVEGDKNLWETTSVNTEVFPGAPSILTIVLKEKKASATKGAGTVSAAELEASIPQKARKEFQRASDAYGSGKLDESIAHLRKAIEYFPNYLMAHNDLGAQLLEQGNIDEAEAELRRAILIDKKAFNPHLNLGIVLVKAKRYAEARDVLDEAISLDPGAPASRLYLGQALDGLGESKSAAKELSSAYELGGDTYAVALLHLGRVLLKANDSSGALKAFERYVSVAPKGPNVAEAERQIALLRQSPQHR